MNDRNSPYQSSHNYEIGLRVENALIRTDPQRFQRVSAVAFYGIVELSGTVNSRDDRTIAVRMAERIPGVTTVIESLAVPEDSRLISTQRLRPEFRDETGRNANWARNRDL